MAHTTPTHCSGSALPLATLPPPSMLAVGLGSLPGSTASPAMMPKPRLWWAVLSFTVCPPSATVMPSWPFSLAVLPSTRAAPTGLPSSSNVPVSSEMPEPPVLLATLSRTRMLTPPPISRPACSDSEASLFCTSRLLVLPASTPLGL